MIYLKNCDHIGEVHQNITCKRMYSANLQVQEHLPYALLKFVVVVVVIVVDVAVVGVVTIIIIIIIIIIIVVVVVVVVIKFVTVAAF